MNRPPDWLAAKWKQKFPNFKSKPLPTFNLFIPPKETPPRIENDLCGKATTPNEIFGATAPTKSVWARYRKADLIWKLFE